MTSDAARRGQGRGHQPSTGWAVARPQIDGRLKQDLAYSPPGATASQPTRHVRVSAALLQFRGGAVGPFWRWPRLLTKTLPLGSSGPTCGGVGLKTLLKSRGLKRAVAIVAPLFASLAVVVGAQAQINAIPAPNDSCNVGHVRLNGQRYPTDIEPEFPVWCYPQPDAQPATRIIGNNDWVDTFDNDGLSIT